MSLYGGSGRHDINPDGTLGERTQRVLKWLDEVRIEGIRKKVEPVAKEASERGCGFWLRLSGGWFVSAEIDENIPKNTCNLVENP